MTTAYHPADALLYEFGLTFASVYLIRLLAYWILPASWAYVVTLASLIAFINDNPFKLVPSGLGARYVQRCSWPHSYSHRHVSLQLRGLFWRIIPLPSFVPRFYITHPASTQLVCTTTVLGAILFLRSVTLPRPISPLILKVLDHVPFLVLQTGIVNVNPNPQRG